MNMIRPSFGLERFPPGTREVVYAEDQPEYLPLPAYRTPDGNVFTCWMPSEEELRSLLAGEPVVLEMLTFNEALQPVRLFVPEREQ